ncbi:hypothetical protein ISN74_04315 [Dyella caseinilytica]|uniref:Glycerophosphoryl diester phosphodiesterase family protein n=2 Tax=Dyella caseinilytica TaxID=1849581 RepID=A0ABX7GVV0_9GAMM|nr:hypothetical protein ISN74_04315 [Dyella caseinilytica]GFZ95441.1 hypothetical protein GCM10011408_14450 [Dyella caseinilytica]
MAYNMPRSAGFSSLGTAMRAAVQWRLLLLWLVIMLIPATVVALPLWHMLGGILDTSVHASEWAQHFSDLMFSDVIFALSNHFQWLGAVAMIGFVLTLLLSPFLDGMIVGSGRAGRALGFGEVLQNGLIEYGRMFRVMFWSLLPYGLLMVVMAASGNMVGKYAETAVLESQVSAYSNLMHVLVLVVFVIVQSIVESARAAFIADVTLRSATRALWRGIRQLVRRPLKTLLFYLTVTVVGLLLASVFAVARIHVTAFGGLGFLLALLLSQLIVVIIGWMRVARLFALAEVARTVVPVRAQAEYR